MNFFSYSILLFLLCSGFVYKADAQRASMSKHSKKAEGLYIFDDQLKEIFPSASINYTDKTIKKTLQFNEDYNSSLIIVMRNFYPKEDDLIELKQYIRRGNNVLIFATSFGPEMLSFFEFSTDAKEKDSFGIVLVDDDVVKKDTIHSKYFRGLDNYFINIPDGKTDVLGINANKLPNFVKTKLGSGHLFIHLHPDIVTNGFIVERPKENYHYTEEVLSYLPRYTHKVIVKLPKPSSRNSYTGNSEQDELSFMAFVLSKPNLRNSLLVLIGVFALAILFGFKLRQRRIPVVKPITNNSLDFAKTMGDLYFNNKNNNDIAVKKILYWKEYIRAKYQIATTNEDNAFWEKVTKKSGASQELINELKMNIATVRLEQQITDKTLIQLSNNIDKFYKS